MNDDIKLKLCALAADAQRSAYAPYSRYKVGAALLAESGKIYTGCNIENAAFGPTVCAERVAIFKAVSEGEREFCMIAVAGGDLSEGASPCGVCRQVMSEFCKEDFVILSVKDGGRAYDSYTLGELLPHSFRLK